MKKAILKKKGIAGLSKMKAADLNQALADHFTEEELAEQFTVRGYQLTDKGKQALIDYQAIIDRHPKKKSISNSAGEVLFFVVYIAGERKGFY